MWDGVPNDQSEWKACGIRELLVKNNVGIIADGGFFLNIKSQKPSDKLKGFTPIRRSSGEVRRRLLCIIFIIIIIFQSVLQLLISCCPVPSQTEDPDAKKPKKKLQPAQRLYNLIVSKHRVVVENTIGSMKRWSVLSGVFRHYHYTATEVTDDNGETRRVPTDDEEFERARLAHIVRVCAKLHNWLVEEARAGRRERSPARAADWSPPVTETEKKIAADAEQLKADGNEQAYKAWDSLNNLG